MPVFSTRIVLDCFYLLIFYSEKFSTEVCRLPYAVNVNLNLSGETDGQTPAAASYYRHVTQKFHGNRIFISCMLNRNPKRLSAEVFSSAQKQPKQNASSENREENGSTTLRNTKEKPLLAGYYSQ